MEALPHDGSSLLDGLFRKLIETDCWSCDTARYVNVKKVRVSLGSDAGLVCLTRGRSGDNLYLGRGGITAPVCVGQDGTCHFSPERQHEVRRVVNVKKVVRRGHGDSLDLLPGALANLPFK